MTISSKCSEMLFQCPGSTTTSELKRSFSCLKEQSNGLARCMLCSQASRCSSPTWKSTAWNWTREVGADQNIRTGFFKSSQISPSSRFIPTLTMTQRPIRPIHSTTSYNNKAEGQPFQPSRPLDWTSKQFALGPWPCGHGFWRGWNEKIVKVQVQYTT